MTLGQALVGNSGCWLTPRIRLLRRLSRLTTKHSAWNGHSVQAVIGNEVTRPQRRILSHEIHASQITAGCRRPGASLTSCAAVCAM